MPENSALLEMVSKIRYDLLQNTKQSSHIKGLFRYFNAAWQELSQEKNALKNPADGLKNRRELGDNNVTTINRLFGQAFVMIRDNIPIDRNAGAELMLIYSIGLNAAYELGHLSDNNKKEFFSLIVEQYNREFHSELKSFDALSLSSRNAGQMEQDHDWQ